jgi:outer membrane protein OmpA-like peptidoglycan-associated protein
MKAFTIITIICSLSIYNLSAQQESFEDEFNRAEKIFTQVYQHGKNEALTYSKEGYADARILFQDLYKRDSTNANVAFKLGVCFLSSRRYRPMAIPFFKKAAADVTNNYNESSPKERKAPLIAYKFLGDAYHLNYQFDNAIEAYQKFIAVMATHLNLDKTLLVEANRNIEMCTTGKMLVANPVKIKIQNLGATVNSTYADYSPVLSADQQTLFFTSRRPDTRGGLKDPDGNFMEDIYKSAKLNTGWSKAINIGSPVNTDQHEASVGISPDGQTILIYKDDKGDGNIYSTTLNGDVWSVPVKLNENINSKYWEPSAFISADGNTIYFTSNKPGGYGGRDLYKSNRSPDGDWGKSINLGSAINSPYDEDAPFIHPNGITLFFSSNAHSTMGGFDIFTSILSNDSVWAEPMNIGYPINTTDDDIFYVVSPNGLNAYFSSFRDGGFGEKDNYIATFLEKKEIPLILVKGVILDETNKPAQNAIITVTDNETERVIAVYHANPKTGEFLFILQPGKNYNITYKADKRLFYSENMEIPKETNYNEVNREIFLPPIIVGSKIVLNNIFFDFDKATLRPLSNVELKNLELILKGNPNMKAEISGHTDSKGSVAYNQKLSDQRAQAVVTSLIERGIDKKRMKAKGYGKSMPSVSNTKLDGSDDPDGRQLNRRVEFTITEIN